MTSNGHRNTNSRTNSEARNKEALQTGKREIILSNLIHKKVVSKSSKVLRHRSQHLILPHEQQLSVRLNCAGKIYESENESSSLYNIGAIDEQAQKRKTHILVETLRSIRSTLNISIRSDYEANETLYSPKACPICCEDYTKGDDIAWSKNEECCHAFHTECIVPWLMEHEECPMCRSDYIYINEID